MYNDIINTIRTTINKKGLKQAYVAKKTGLTQQEFSNIMCGRKTFQVTYVKPVCEALGITPNELFGINIETRS